SRDCDEVVALSRAIEDELTSEDGNSDYRRIESAMAVSHMVKPSGKLADFILSLKSVDSRTAYLDDDPASVALSLFPSGRWAEALIKLASAMRSPALSGLYLRREGLTPPQRKLV